MSYDSISPTEIAEGLKGWRQVRGLTQRVLAERSAGGYVNIARRELGRTDPRLFTLEKLAKALNVTVADLLGEGKPARRRAGR